MKKILLFGFILALSGCINTKTEYSEVLHEKATITSLIYSPSKHDVSLKPTAFDHGDGTDLINMGTDYDGNVGIKIGDGIQITETTVPEIYGVAFQCQHGSIIIQGDKQKYKVLYDKLRHNVSDTVDVLYKEEYLVTYDDNNKVTNRVLKDLDFIDAQLLK